MDEGEGLSRRAVRLLGFDQMCQCGHEYGLHQAPGTECVVMDCKCGTFRWTKQLSS